MKFYFDLDLVTQIQYSGGGNDPRCDEYVAQTLSVNPIILMSLKHSTPQQTSLNLFYHLNPGYSAKIKLGSINKLELSKSGLLESILVFSQHAAPGVRYKIQDLRGARYQLRKTNDNISHAMGSFEKGSFDQGDSQQNINRIEHHKIPIGSNDKDIDESM